MAGMPGRSGGPREGQPGKSYPNRTDLNKQPVTAAPGQQYGQRAQQEAAQQAVPLPQVRPGALPLSAPTRRPDEPVTAGLPFGPGPGPEILPTQPAMIDSDETATVLRELYRRFPNPDLFALISQLDAEGR